MRPAEITPVVLRFQDGPRIPGLLQCVSLTGGLLALSELLPEGSIVNLMFVTPAGPVRGTAEMLPAGSWTQQPFRFAAIQEADQRRLRATIQSVHSHGTTGF
jgi:hypothetical protein